MFGKIGLIIKREYLTRVKKRSFIIMTVLGPLLFVGLMVVPVWIAQKGQTNKIVAVVDEPGILSQGMKEKENLKFLYLQKSFNEAKKDLAGGKYDALLYVPEVAAENLQNGLNASKLFTKTNISLNNKLYIETQMEKQVERAVLKSNGVDDKLLETLERKNRVTIKMVAIDEEQKQADAQVEVKTAVAFIGGILIYFFIFLFGAMVMRGVIEEKTSRIVELMISSVRPFQLMMGKIVGIALVGLTQFLLWIILSASVYFVVISQFVDKKYSTEQVEQMMQRMPAGAEMEQLEKMQEVSGTIDSISSVNWPLMLGVFLFYFIFGYLFYGAFFAAIGSAVDSESDTQQFMLPITIPLILSFVMAQNIIEDPQSSLAVWMSYIPFTSPVIMLIRMPFEVQYYELILSMVILVLSFIGSTWIAGKIYRVGILMYGKKPTYKELWKWLRY